ncbi:chloroplast inner envelope translocon protein [Klebsormidium nitens]|uniref:Chloroplast inner envelope translocon protein n=1 Tax=Klebsormidium nitens TaxID=105231 RepID=A0A1Y1I906_KLENI|nr:chloroplast inner envelope translocon protein [Klebsormidium nitens]|eukprot:GAQ87464.1 chloroplast inner envelope translocon protein [Klebsormidium nitens]
MECALLTRGGLGGSTLALQTPRATFADTPARLQQKSLLLRQHSLLQSGSRTSFLKEASSFHTARQCRPLLRRSSVRGAVSLAAPEAGVPPPKQALELGGEIPLTGLQPVVRNLSQPLKLGVCALLVLGLGGAGAAVAGKNWIFGAIGGAGVGLGAAFAVDKTHKSLAAIELHNALVKHPNVLKVNKADIHAIAERYGVSTSDENFTKELKGLYDAYLTSILPPGNENLKGDEVEKIIAFKDALGLEDADAAPVHIELGRRIHRSRMETGDRELATAERRAFQKLVFVSQLVFGDAAGFLLPWKRSFEVNDSQVAVAIRDNGLRIFSEELKSLTGPDVSKLRELRRLQRKVKLDDEVVAEPVRTKLRELGEGNIQKALEIQTARTRIKDTAAVLQNLRDLLAYNKQLEDIQNQEDPDSIVPGVGPITLSGGQYDSDRTMKELKELYRQYLGEALNSKKLADDKVAELALLKNIFGLGNKEADALTMEVTARVYRRRLRAAVQDGTLEGAASKAEFLEELCDDIRLDPDQAFKINEEIYRQKLESCLEDKKLDDEDVKALQRLRVLLCVPKATVDAAHDELCGKIFTAVIDEALSESIDAVTPHALDLVHNSKQNLRLDQDMAVNILSRAVRAIFLSYIKRARAQPNRLETAKELKKMVFFSNMVVRPLLEDVKGQKIDIQAELKALEAAPEEEEEEEEILEETDEEKALPSSLRKSLVAAKREQRKAQKGKGGTMKAQKDINVKDELELPYRQELYRGFLLYCLSGDVVTLPLGAQIVIDRDESEFVRLAQLGDILGLSPADVSGVHKGLAEQAFRTNAQNILSEGMLTPEKMERLTKLREQLGLTEEMANAVIRSITASKMVSGVDSAIASGKLTIKDVRGFRESGVDIDSMVNKELRMKMYKKHIETLLSSGTGIFDETEVYETLPNNLGLDVARVKKLAQDLAKERKRGALVQSISLLRQKRQKELAAEVRNLIAADRAAPDAKAEWGVQDELLDLYGVFLSEKPTDEEKQRLARILKIDDDTAKRLDEVVKSGNFELAEVEDDNSIF